MWGVPKNIRFIMENPTKRMIWRYPYFRNPPYVELGGKLSPATLLPQVPRHPDTFGSPQGIWRGGTSASGRRASSQKTPIWSEVKLGSQKVDLGKLYSSYIYIYVCKYMHTHLHISYVCMYIYIDKYNFNACVCIIYIYIVYVWVIPKSSSNLWGPCWCRYNLPKWMNIKVM